MEKYQKNWLKFIVGFILCMIVRLIPFRPPNVEPILATQMPFSKSYGAFPGFLFAFFSIILFDLITGHYGMWSFLTAGTYGLLGFWAFYFLKEQEPSRWSYVRFAILGTLFFDGVTGLSIGPLFFHQSFMEALVGQIPFTMWHLAGNISFAFILSPALYSYVIKNEKLENSYLTKVLLKKSI